MSSFIRRENSYIYLIHRVEGKNALRLSTKLKVEPSDWNAKEGRVKDKLLTYNGINVQSELSRYENALIEALILTKGETVEELRECVNSLLNKRKKYTYNSEMSSKLYTNTDLLSYFETFAEETKAKKQSNYKHYYACKNHVSEFSGGKRVPFSSVDMKFYKRFSQHLQDKALSMNTIANQFKLLKAVMQSAFMEGLHTNEAFRYFKRPMEQSDSVYLSEVELERIYNLSLSGTLDVVRDYFIVGAYTGLRFEDWDRVALGLVKDNILSIRASKTNEKSLIPLHPYVRAVLEKHGGSMPRKMSNQKMNEYLRIVTLRAEIEEPVETRITRGGERQVSVKPKCELVTTHTARRSLATNLILRGVSPFVVMKVTGHRSMSSFERYVKLQELQASIELRELDFFK